MIFEDVKTILFNVDDDSQFDLVLHFLSLLGLPSARHLLRKSSSSYHHHQLHSSLISSFDQIDAGGGVFAVHFLRGSWRHPASSLDDSTVDHQLRLEMTRNVLEASMKRFRGERKSIFAGVLIESFLSAVMRFVDADDTGSGDGADAKRLKTLKKAVKSSAKEILSDADLRSSPTSLHAWIAYALVEWQLNKPDDARKILDNAAEMFAAAPLSEHGDLEAVKNEAACLGVKVCLHRIRAELELGCCLIDDQMDSVTTSDDYSMNAISRTAVAKTHLMEIVGTSSAEEGGVSNENTRSLLTRKRLSTSQDRLLAHLTAQCLEKACDCDFACNCNLSGDCIRQIRRIADALFEVVVCAALFEFCLSGVEEASKSFQQSANQLRPFFTLPPSREDSFDPLKSEPLFLYERIVCHHVKFLAWVRKGGWRLKTSSSSSDVAVPLDPNKNYKQLLWQSVQQFPDNAFLTRLFLRSSSSSAYASFHLHRRLNSLVKLASTPMLLFVAFHEFHDRFRAAESATSGQWLLSMMRHATTSEWKHSVLLWRQLFRMHLVVGGGGKTEKQELDARDPVVYLQHQVSAEAAWSFYESLRFCPWAKQIYLDKIRNDFKQWEHVVDMMTEKELRVRFPIEEFKVLLENS